MSTIKKGEVISTITLHQGTTSSIRTSSEVEGVESRRLLVVGVDYFNWQLFRRGTDDQRDKMDKRDKRDEGDEGDTSRTSYSLVNPSRDHVCKTYCILDGRCGVLWGEEVIFL